MTNPLRSARLAVVPHLSHRRAAEAIGCCLSTVVMRERPDFDPAKLPMVDLEATAHAYGCTVNQLLGREPLAQQAAS